MTDLMRTLYEYTCQRHMTGIWHQPEYREYVNCAEHKEDSLRQHLDRDGQRLLDELYDQLSCQHSLELEILFQAAFSLSRELNGLLRP